MHYIDTNSSWSGQRDWKSGLERGIAEGWEIGTPAMSLCCCIVVGRPARIYKLSF